MADPKLQRQRTTSPSVVLASGDPEVILRELTRRWVAPCLGPEFGISWGPASRDATVPRVEVRLVCLTPVTVPRQSRQPPPTRVAARLAITVRAATLVEADKALMALALGSGDTGFPEIDGQAEALHPATDPPCLMIRVELERERLAQAAPRVREPLVTKWSHPATIRGRVIGPGGRPVAGAMLEVSGLGVTGYSNHHGDFALGSVGRGDGLDAVLLISARGLTFEHRLAADANPHDVTVLLPFPESGP